MSDQQPDPWSELDRRVRYLIIKGTNSCGSGFGKYPLGIRDAVREIEPALNRNSAAYPELQQLLAAFDERLSR